MSIMPAVAATVHATAHVNPIMYITVSGDILGTFRQWTGGIRDTSQTSITYSAQFFDLARKRQRAGIVLGNAPVSREESSRDMTIAVGPAAEGGSGLVFHFRMVMRALANCWQIWRRAPTDVIVMDGAGYWFPLALISRPGRRIYLSIHTVLWSTKPGRLRRIALQAEAWFIRTRCDGVLAVSDTIADQVSTLCNGKHPPIRVFSPTYVDDDFVDVKPARSDPECFEILYAGRIEEGKGVFDLIEIAQQLIKRQVPPFRITICGSGTDLATLQERIRAEQLEHVMLCLGHQQRSAMIEQLSNASCLIAPTRSTFVEGFNKVVVEAVLAGRPVITSRVCPALQEVAEAAVEVEPDDVTQYADAIERLMLDHAMFDHKVAATHGLKRKFLDFDNSWMAGADAILAG